MLTYRLEIMEQLNDGLPEEHFRQQHEFIAANDEDAIALAYKRYNRLAGLTVLDRFMLYEGERLVHDLIGPELDGAPG